MIQLIRAARPLLPLLGLVLLLAGCGAPQSGPGSGIYGGQASPTPAPTQAVPAATPPQAAGTPAQEAGGAEARVEMRNTSFQPQRITITPGTTVIWTNRDSFPHTVTAGTRGNPSGLFDSGNVPAGGTFSFTFQDQGAYDYFCSIHPGMSGTVVVE